MGKQHSNGADDGMRKDGIGARPNGETQNRPIVQPGPVRAAHFHRRRVIVRACVSGGVENRLSA